MGALRIFVLALGFVFADASAKADDTVWTSREYVDLFFRHYNGHMPLPHLREEKQRALFRHLIDPSNIARIVEAHYPHEEKLRQLQIMLAMLGGFRADYNMAVVVGEPLETELALVQAYSLEVAAALSPVMREQPDAAGATSAWRTMIEGVMQSIEDRTHYSPAQSALMAEAMARNYPAIAKAIPEHDRDYLRARALKLKTVENSDVLASAIGRMKRALLSEP
jgi:hypothetical protein